MGWETIVGLGSKFASNARALWAWLQIDTTDPTLAKLALLFVVVVLLLWVLGDVYRGEIQNNDFEIGLTSHGNKFGYGDRDAVFTQQTFDIQTERLPAALKIFHTFTILDGEKRRPKRVVVQRLPLRLRMVRTAHRVEHGQIAFSPSTEAAVKNRAERLQRLAAKRYAGSFPRRLRTLFGKQQPDVRVDVHAYLVRIHFSANPAFLLFLHPDRDVKATGWLTLLTSLFALLTEFLF